MIKHETSEHVSRNVHTATSATSTYHLDHLRRVQVMNLKKVRPHASGSRMESMTNLNTVEMKGRSELARGAAVELVRSESEGIRRQV